MSKIIKTVVLMLIITLAFASTLALLIGCSNQDYDFIMISTKGNVMDDSYNEDVWNALKSYCEESSQSYSAMSPLGGETTDYQKTIAKAINKFHAKYIICADTVFDDILTKEFTSQFPDTSFIYFCGVEQVTNYAKTTTTLEDGSTQELPYVVPDNVIYVNFKEEDLGYLAGYAAVTAGETELAVVGACYKKQIENSEDVLSITYSSVQNYYYGFVQGAEAAAATLDKTVRLQYSLKRIDDSELARKNLYSSLISNGAHTVFSVMGMSYNKVMAEKAVNEGVLAINPDNDLRSIAGSDSSAYYTSVALIEKDYKGALHYVIENSDSLYAKETRLGAAENSVSISVDPLIEPLTLSAAGKTAFASAQSFTVALGTEVLASIKDGLKTKTLQTELFDANTLSKVTVREV